MTTQEKIDRLTRGNFVPSPLAPPMLPVRVVPAPFAALLESESRPRRRVLSELPSGGSTAAEIRSTAWPLSPVPAPAPVAVQASGGNENSSRIGMWAAIVIPLLALAAVAAAWLASGI